jgi:hypothetical protein
MAAHSCSIFSGRRASGMAEKSTDIVTPAIMPAGQRMPQNGSQCPRGGASTA